MCNSFQLRVHIFTVVTIQLQIQSFTMEDLPAQIISEEKHHKITIKKLGICLDHASANIIVFTTNPAETLTIESSFTHQVKEQTLSKSEHIMHNKEKQQMHDYYKQLCDVVKEYDEVLLFGPTDAKYELSNILKS